jgi:ABC-2 type transport system ATP-binding protein
VQLQKPLDSVPEALSKYGLSLMNDGTELVYAYDTKSERTGITAFLSDLSAANIRFRDLQTEQSSLEDIFVGLVDHK